jgi:replicative DNA helicase
VGATDLNDRYRAGTLPKDPEDEAILIERRRIPRMADAFAAADRLVCAGPQPNPLRTGFDELDFGLKRLGRKEFTMLAADSGIGKSTISTQIALHVAASGHGVVYLNLEMSEEMYGLRTAANFMQIPTQKAASHSLTPEEHSSLARGFSMLHEPAKHIALGNRKEHCTIPSIKKFCEDAARTLSAEGYPLRLIVVDHILEVQVNAKKNDKDAEGQARSDLLKDLCESFDLHVIALVHITREGSKSGTMPTKNQLASSAWFDRAPDNILVFHQSRRDDGTFDPEQRAKLSCQKSRWGEPFAVELEYRKGFFYPWSLEPRTAAPQRSLDPERPTTDGQEWAPEQRED